MELIREWYNGTRNYAVGVQLYLEFGQDEALKAFFQSDRTPFREQKLAEELKALLVGPPEPALPDVAPAGAAYELPGNTFSGDSVVEELYRQKSTLHKQKDLLRHSLEVYATDEERGVAAHRILKLRREITAIWEKELYYKDHGRLPTDDPGITDPAALKHRRGLVKGYMRGLRMKLKKSPGDADYLAAMAKYQAEEVALAEKIKKYGKAT